MDTKNVSVSGLLKIPDRPSHKYRLPGYIDYRMPSGLGQFLQSMVVFTIRTNETDAWRYAVPASHTRNLVTHGQRDLCDGETQPGCSTQYKNSHETTVSVTERESTGLCRRHNENDVSGAIHW